MTVDAAVEPGRHEEHPFPVEGHGRGIRHAAGERLARTVRTDDEKGDRRLLAPRAAERDVEVAVSIEGRTVDEVEAGRKGRGHVDVRRFAWHAVEANGEATLVARRR